jgi:outer membrane protein assembly factor BamB
MTPAKSRFTLVRPIFLVLIVTLLLAVITVGVLVTVFGMQVELRGSRQPRLVFDDREEHYADLEENRSQHYSHLLPAAQIKAEGTNSGTPYWTDFRGPERDGRYTQDRIRTDWPTSGLTPLWRQPIGGGYASFTVAEGRAFTIEQRRDQEVVTAYDVETGRELWNHAWDSHFQERMGGPGPRATPTWHDGRVYALGATGFLWSLSATTGDVIWERNILEDSQGTNLEWAMSSSPLVIDKRVIVQPGGPDGWSVVAYDLETSDVVWHTLDDLQSYTSPMSVTLAGQPQVLIVTASRVAGLGTDDGRLLWEHPWSPSTVPNIAQPILVADNQLFLSASYGHGATLLELIPQDRGIVVETVWRNNRMKNRFSSSVLHNGYIYGLDESILACIDAFTGELQWKGGRYGYGQLLLAGDHLVVLTEDGELVLVYATPDGHDEVASTTAIDGKTWNVPALADGRLFVRNAREMAAFDLRSR